jgi:hypothetical protein
MRESIALRGIVSQPRPPSADFWGRASNDSSESDDSHLHKDKFGRRTFLYENQALLIDGNVNANRDEGIGPVSSRRPVLD